MTAITYRPDIDGLRAIAVLSVVLYHYGMQPLNGGFVGVDVFFVISGYLITKIIHRQVSEGRFTFADFYERRVRRIFPALFAMLAATLMAGLLILLPSDLKALSNASIATLLFASNVLFWRQSGYFDPSAELNPLLHTWSLAVEEQFYIVFPILLIIVERYAARWLKPLLALAALASFAACVALQGWQPAAMFYLSPFRAWELSLGALLAIEAVPPIASRRLREAVAATALAVLLGSLWWTEAGLDFPGWQAAFPVVATAALIFTGGGAPTVVHRLLAARPLVLVGLISYSLYLWHWPVIVYAKYLGGGDLPAFGFRLLLIVVSLALGAASYRWVETPFRRARTAGKRRSGRLFVVAASVSAALAGGALLLKANDGWAARFAPPVLALDAARRPTIPFQACDGAVPSATRAACTIGVGAGPVTLLWGDSHAMSWAPALSEPGFGPVVLALKSACPPLPGVEVNYGWGCGDFNAETLDWIERNRPERIVLAGAWTEYSRPDAFYSLTDRDGARGNKAVFGPALSRTVASLAPFAREIVVIGPTPGAPTQAPFRTAMAKVQQRAPAAGVPLAEVTARAGDFWTAARALPGEVRLVDPLPWFCDAATCRYLAGDALLYRDEAHLSVAGARFSADKLRAALAASMPKRTKD